MVKSNITGKIYNPDNSSVLYLTNLQQIYKYLNADKDVANELVDILYSNTKNNCIVFVFNKTPMMQQLYLKWQNHEL